MKRNLLSTLLLAFSLFVSAYDVEIDGICYNLNRNEQVAEVSCLHYHLGEITWSGTYRFASESYSTGDECYVVPMDIWERLKTETFYATIKGENPTIYLTNGWWSYQYTNDYIMPGNELLADNGDGTWTLSVNLVGDPILELLDERHLLFTGFGYSVEDIYLKNATADGSDDGQEIEYVWKNGTCHSDEANIPEKITYEDVEYTVTSIGVNGLSGFSGLTSVTIPNEVKRIGDYTFAWCWELASVVIPSSVTSIGAYAFEACRLRDVYCYASQVPETFEDISFQDASIGEATLHVPAGSIDNYRSTAPWNGFMNIVALTDGDPSGIGQIVNGAVPTHHQHIYNLNGQRVGNTAKGILIQNGKKFMVK